MVNVVVGWRGKPCEPVIWAVAVAVVTWPESRFWRSWPGQMMIGVGRGFRRRGRAARARLSLAMPLALRFSTLTAW